MNPSPVLKFVVTHPLLTLLFWVAFLALSLLGLSGMKRDPSVDAFIPTDHPSYQTAEEVEKIFGLSDPIVIALEFEGGVFSAPNLREIQRLHDHIANVEGVRYNGVTSLASESYVTAGKDTVDVRRYIDNVGDIGNVSAVDDPAGIKAARRGYLGMRPHVGTLVSHDERSAALLVEPAEGWPSHVVYNNVVAALAQAPPEKAIVHIGGLGAVTGFLSQVISDDVARLVPFTYVVVMLLLYIGFRDWRVLLVPLPVLSGSVLGTLGLMAALDIPYYAITSALPVLLVAIAMADTIHVLTAFREQADTAGGTGEIVTASLIRIVRPISFTSLTTVIGFSAIGLASIMPPIIHFAWFACIGIALAWLFSLTVLPAVMVVLKMKPSRLGWGHSWAGVASALTGRSGSLKLVFVGLLLVAGTLTTQITVDRSLVSAFPDATPVRVADEYLNTHFAGTAFLDVYIDSGSMDGALDPEFLSQLSALQLFMETLPHVQKTVSVLDYLKEMHRALNDERSVSGVGVTQVEIEQELFLYESGATPESLRQELDFDRRRVLVRGVMNSRYSSEEDETVARLQKYVDANFVGAAEVNLSGRVNTRYHWMSRLGASHVAGVALSLMLVFVAASLLFRSLTMGVLCVLPVVLAVLSVYSVMFLSGGYLEPATSMFAAISIGVGVDYAIHLLYRLRLESKLQQDYPSAVAATLRHVGRACMYNALGIGLGVLVLALSSLGTLQNFGVLIATATFAGLVASFVFLPALYRPAAPQRAVLLVAVCCACLLPWQEPLASTTGVGIAQKVDSRAEPAASIRTLSIVLVNRSGRTRSREATVLRRTDGSKTESLFVLSAPAALRDVAFLTLSDTTGRDQRWLFRPIADRARRLPAANRGDAFIGTDFSYADVQSHLKFDLEEFRFSPAAQYGSDQWHLTGELKTERLQRELGYTRILARGDRATYLPRKIDFLDGQGQVSKSITVPSVTMLGDFALPSEIVATTRRSGHKTMFKYGETRLLESVPDRLFDASSLRKGLSVELSRMQ